MCGRYCITSAPEAIRALFRYPELPNLPPRFNVAPTQPVPIVRVTEGERHFALVRWGLIPAWVKDPKAFTLLINARGESVNDKPAFRNAMKRRRCLFPADGFYEWKSVAGRKRPYLARPRAGGPIAFAGLWETWMGPNGEEMETAAIITTDANKEMAEVHHRAPVIVPPEQSDFWLDCVNVDERTAAELIAPAPDGAMEVYEISPEVNRAANDSSALLEPYSADATEAQQTSEPPPADAPPAARPARRRRRGSDDGQASLF
jgi:putative SOS response-associated peptidase YedK